MSLLKGIRPAGARLVIISDTHGLHRSHRSMPKLPFGDILLHGGDSTYVGRIASLIDFKQWINSLSYRHKVFIAGNHELPLESKYFVEQGVKKFDYGSDSSDAASYSAKCREVVNGDGSIYLEDSSYSITPRSLTKCVSDTVLVETGNDSDSAETISVYGSPWQPTFGKWAFNADRGEDILQHWKKIPAGVDILMTHGPPMHILDANDLGQPCGCEDLKNEVLNRVKPRIHIFGHVHTGYGFSQHGDILFVNGSTCDEDDEPVNRPIVIHLPFDKTLPAEIVPLKEQEFL